MQVSRRIFFPSTETVMDLQHDDLHTQTTEDCITFA